MKIKKKSYISFSTYSQNNVIFEFPTLIEKIYVTLHILNVKK